MTPNWVLTPCNSFTDVRVVQTLPGGVNVLVVQENDYIKECSIAKFVLSVCYCQVLVLLSRLLQKFYYCLPPERYMRMHCHCLIESRSGREESFLESLTPRCLFRFSHGGTRNFEQDVRFAFEEN